MEPVLIFAEPGGGLFWVWTVWSMWIDNPFMANPFLQLFHWLPTVQFEQQAFSPIATFTSATVDTMVTATARRLLLSTVESSRDTAGTPAAQVCMACLSGQSCFREACETFAIVRVPAKWFCSRARNIPKRACKSERKGVGSSKRQ